MAFQLVLASKPQKSCNEETQLICTQNMQLSICFLCLNLQHFISFFLWSEGNMVGETGINKLWVISIGWLGENNQRPQWEGICSCMGNGKPGNVEAREYIMQVLMSLRPGTHRSAFFVCSNTSISNGF